MWWCYQVTAFLSSPEFQRHSSTWPSKTISSTDLSFKSRDFPGLEWRTQITVGNTTPMNLPKVSKTVQPYTMFRVWCWGGLSLGIIQIWMNTFPVTFRQGIYICTVGCSEWQPISWWTNLSINCRLSMQKGPQQFPCSYRAYYCSRMSRSILGFSPATIRIRWQPPAQLEGGYTWLWWRSGILHTIWVGDEEPCYKPRLQREPMRC